VGPAFPLPSPCPAEEKEAGHRSKVGRVPEEPLQQKACTPYSSRGVQEVKGG